MERFTSFFLTFIIATSFVGSLILDPDGVFQTNYQQKAIQAQLEGDVLNVEFMIVTPCIKKGDCYDFNDEILNDVTKFYRDYDIEVSFIKQNIVIEEPISIDLQPSTPAKYAIELKNKLIKITGKDMPHVLHAPMFAGDPNNKILGIASEQLELIVLDQEMIDSKSNEWEAHVLAHEIGHIFALPDLYSALSCNLMDGYASQRSFMCQRLTGKQVKVMRDKIKRDLM